jgi:hypothetical protein
MFVSPEAATATKHNANASKQRIVNPPWKKHYLKPRNTESGYTDGVQPFTSFPFSRSCLIRWRIHGELRSDAADNHSSVALGAFGSLPLFFTIWFLPPQ